MESVLMNTSFIRNQPILSLRYAYDTSGEQTIMPAFQIHRSGDGNSHAHDLVWYAAERDGRAADKFCANRSVPVAWQGYAFFVPKG